MRLLAGATIGPLGQESNIGGSRQEGGDLQALRGHNRGSILKILLRSPGGRSISSLHLATSLSRPTVELALTDLIAAGLVEEIELSASTSRGGRRARQFAVATELGLVAGAVIGIERVEVVISDLFGNIIARSEQMHASGEDSHGQVKLMVDELMQSPEIMGRKLNFVTVGVIGYTDPSGRVHRSTGIDTTTTQEFQSIVSGDFGCPVVIENDANLAATAEYTQLARPEIRDMIGLHADVAVGCGLIIDGKLHRGFGGTAGELGFHRQLGWNDTDCAIRETAAQHEVTVRELYRQAGLGTPWAEQVTNQYALAIAPGLLAMVLTINPQMVIIGGSICDAGEAFRGPLEKFISDHAPSAPEIVFSELGRDCIALGALIRSLNHMRQLLEDRAYSDQH